MALYEALWLTCVDMYSTAVHYVVCALMNHQTWLLLYIVSIFIHMASLHTDRCWETHKSELKPHYNHCDFNQGLSLWPTYFLTVLIAVQCSDD